MNDILLSLDTIQTKINTLSDLWKTIENEWGKLPFIEDFLSIEIKFDPRFIKDSKDPNDNEIYITLTEIVNLLKILGHLFL